jgi:hypothetical protein
MNQGNQQGNRGHLDIKEMLTSNSYTTVISSGMAHKRPSAVAKGQPCAIAVAAIMRSAGSPCIERKYVGIKD